MLYFLLDLAVVTKKKEILKIILERRNGKKNQNKKKNEFGVTKDRLRCKSSSSISFTFKPGRVMAAKNEDLEKAGAKKVKFLGKKKSFPFFFFY